MPATRLIAVGGTTVRPVERCHQLPYLGAPDGGTTFTPLR